MVGRRRPCPICWLTACVPSCRVRLNKKIRSSGQGVAEARAWYGKTILTHLATTAGVADAHAQHSSRSLYSTTATARGVPDARMLIHAIYFRGFWRRGRPPIALTTTTACRPGRPGRSGSKQDPSRIWDFQLGPCNPLHQRASRTTKSMNPRLEYGLPRRKFFEKCTLNFSGYITDACATKGSEDDPNN